MSTVVAVINHWPSADSALDKAKKISQATHAQVFVYCPVSSALEEMNRYIGFDNYEVVKANILQETQERLDELLAGEPIDSEVTWQPKSYSGVIDKAQELSATMIVMSASEHNVIGDYFHRPDDWRVLREVRCPTLILSPMGEEYREVVVAVDVLDEDESHEQLNARLLDEAKLMADIWQLPLHVVSIVPDPSSIYADIAAAGSLVMADFRSQAEEAAKVRQQQLLDRLGVSAKHCTVVTGRVDRQLEETLAASGLLVIGTLANKGLKGVFQGNTSERLLRHLRGDILVVP